MGASRSTPQTAHIDNPNGRVPIHVTPSVLSRLQNAENEVNDIKHQQQQLEKNIPQNNPEATKKERFAEDWSQVKDLLQDKYDTLEEYEFDKTVEKVQNLLGQPLKWTEAINDEIVRLRVQLIQCLRDNPGESLSCSDIANKYQKLIFREQYRKLNRRENSRCSDDSCCKTSNTAT